MFDYQKKSHFWIYEFYLQLHHSIKNLFEQHYSLGMHIEQIEQTTCDIHKEVNGQSKHTQTYEDDYNEDVFGGDENKESQDEEPEKEVD